jgi:cytochrome c-type biogenesis protein
VIDGTFAVVDSVALMAGMVAAVSPCGFAMLPAYLSFFLGLEGRRGDGPVAVAVGRALVVGLTMTAGVLAVFLPIGLLVKAGDWSVKDVTDAAKWPAVGISVVLIALGVALLWGWHLPWSTPRLDRGGDRATYGSIALFGVSYAVTSLSCSFPYFLGAIINSFDRDGVGSGIGTLGSYGLGMGLVITALTVTLASGQRGLLRVLRAVMRHSDRIAGAFLVLTGLYLAWYWLLRSDEGGTDPVENLATDLQQFLNGQGSTRMGLLLAAVIAGAAAFAVSSRRGARTTSAQFPPEPAD